MKVIEQMPMKYKHYSVVIATLAFLVYILEPLWLHVASVRAELLLLENRAEKLDKLVLQTEQLAKATEQSQAQLDNAQQWLFLSSSESEFKIAVQEDIEAMLESAACDVERVGWESSTLPYSSFNKWSMELKFQGNPICMIKVTRSLESHKPVILIDNVSFRTQGWNGNIDTSIDATMNISFYHIGGSS